MLAPCPGIVDGASRERCGTRRVRPLCGTKGHPVSSAATAREPADGTGTSRERPVRSATDRALGAGRSSADADSVPAARQGAGVGGRR